MGTITDWERNSDLNKKLVRFITHLKNISSTRQTVKKSTMEYITPAIGYYPRKGQIADIDPRSKM